MSCDASEIAILDPLHSADTTEDICESCSVGLPCTSACVFLLLLWRRRIFVVLSLLLQRVSSCVGLVPDEVMRANTLVCVLSVIER